MQQIYHATTLYVDIIYIFAKISYMKVKQIEHIGIAVKSIAESRVFYETILGLNCYAIEEVPEQKVKTAFFRIGEIKIELLEPTSPDSPVAKFIEKRGEGMHHIAYAVDNTADALSFASDKAIQLIDNKPRNGAEQMQIGFLHPKSTGGVLTEFCSK